MSGAFDIWAELGIASGADAKAIRRAYAARLRTIDPDADPAAFQRLRLAYEHAQRQLAWREQKAARALEAQAQTDAEPARAETAANADIDAQPRQTVLLPPRPVPEPEPARRPVPMPPRIAPPPPARTREDEERDAAVRAINASLEARDSAGAIAALTSALARGLLPLGEREHALESIMPMVAADKTLSAEDYLAIVDRVGWNTVPGVREQWTPVRKAATARAEAENWYLELKLTAQGRGRMGMASIRSPATAAAQAFRATAAKRMLDGGSSVFVSAGAAAALSDMLKAYRAQEDWLTHRFAPQAMGKLESGLKNRGLAAKALRYAVIGALVLAGALVAIGAGLSSGGIGFIFLGSLIYRIWKRR